MIFYSVLTYLFTVLTVSGETKDYRIVNTTQGPIKGYRGVEGNYYTFYGIPYATTPKGPHKFKAPLPPPSWKSPFEAINKYIVCPQYNWPILSSMKMQEECLIANIFVPDTQVSNMPVLVHFHGGAYQYGYGDIEKVTKLLQIRNLVIVNFNYRLSTHGLLCLGTKDIPGNAGMKDQVALLRWVQKNIAAFGGNPNDVTIDGWSAGAAAVELQMISKMSNGLFHKVIIESGAGSGAFSIQFDPLANAKTMAKHFGLKNADNLDILEQFYKNATPWMINSFDVTDHPNSTVIFAPCIERDFGEEMFLDDYPISILKKGDYPKLPLLTGVTASEGIFRTNFFEEWKIKMNKKFSDFLPEDINYKNETEKENIAGIIKHFYFGENPVSDENVLRYVDFFTDVMFSYSVLKSSDFHVQAGNKQVYLYEYAFVNDYEPYIPHTNYRGASHCAQSYAFFDSLNEEQLSKEYKKMKTVIRDIWLNFIFTGKPVLEGSAYPVWPPVSRKRSPYMSLNSTLELKNTMLLNGRGLFWDEIYHRYYREPMRP